MIATVVVMISVLTAINSHISSFASMQSSRETTLAVGDLQAAMESLLVLQVDQIPIAGSEFEIAQPIARFTDLHLKGESIVATYPGYTIGGPIPNPLQIVLTIGWKDQKGRARRISARTAKAE